MGLSAHHASDAHLATADRIALTVNVSLFDLAHPSLRGVDYGLRVGRADLPDARVFNALLPREKLFAVESGSAQVSVMRAAACPATVRVTGLREAMPPPSYCLALPR